MHEQTAQYWADEIPDSAQRRTPGGGSLLLVLFVLAALPPVTLAQGLEHQAVLELIGTISESPKRDSQRELRHFRNARPGHPVSHHSWFAGLPPAALSQRSHGPEAGPTRSVFPCELGTRSGAALAHLRTGLHDLPPPGAPG